MNRSHRQREGPPTRAFTLLEVLVVVAIIALLVAILLPSLDQARQHVRRVTCQANLRQIAQAWEMYLRDSHDHFLRGTNKEYNYGGLQGKGSSAFGSNPSKPVPKPLNVYLKLNKVIRAGGEVFHCPCDQGTSFVRPTVFQYYGTSYYPNNLLIGQNQVWVPPGDPCSVAPFALWTNVNQRIAKLTRSGVDGQSRVILIGDFTWLDHWDLTVPDEFPYWHRTPGSHNLAFTDGHAEFVRIRKGIHVTDRYSILPCKDLRSEACQCQQEVPRE